MDNSNSVSSSQGSAWFSQVTEEVTSFFSDIGSRLNVVLKQRALKACQLEVMEPSKLKK